MRRINPEMARHIASRLDGDLSRFFTLPERDLAKVLETRTRLFAADVRSRALEEARREMDFIASNGIRTLWYTDEAYPRRLLECDDAPLMLYAVGHTDLNNAKFLSIVGTRHATAYGCMLTRDIVAELAEKMEDQLVVVSGLAYGIDVAAHTAALEAKVPTVGVLAHGLNTIYPASHRDIAARMVRAGGALLTDYRSIDATHRGNFLARNRIVAGMADALLVVESDEKGGAMVTARLAGAYSRDVFAVPGRAGDRFSRGCNRLIATDRARLITSGADIAAEMNWPLRQPEGTQQELFTPLSPDEEAVVAAITSRKGEASLSELTALTAIPTHRLLAMLVDMELRQLIISLPGALYRLV